MDHVPRTAPSEQIDCLDALARQVVNQLELRRHAKQLERAAATVLRSRSASIPAASAPVAGRMTANSSPPQRALKSLGRCSRAASGRHSGARHRRPGGRRIVVVLELVDVYEQQRQRRPIAAVAVKFLRQTLIKGDAVAKAAELVGEALLLQAEIGLLKLAW